MDKRRVIKDFEKLDDQLKDQVLQHLSLGINEELITLHDDHNSQKILALPFETDDTRFLVKFTGPALRNLLDTSNDTLEGELPIDYEIQDLDAEDLDYDLDLTPEE